MIITKFLNTITLSLNSFEFFFLLIVKFVQNMNSHIEFLLLFLKISFTDNFKWVFVWERSVSKWISIFSFLSSDHANTMVVFLLWFLAYRKLSRLKYKLAWKESISNTLNVFDCWANWRFHNLSWFFYFKFL